MIPTAASVPIGTEIDVTEQTNRTYKLTDTRIVGLTDDLDAIKQAIYKITQTERYVSVIYSFDYGVEFWNVLGKPREYAQAEIIRTLTDALLWDARIVSVDNFLFDFSGDNALVTFDVLTNLGTVEAGVQIAI